MDRAARLSKRRKKRVGTAAVRRDNACVGTTPGNSAASQNARSKVFVPIVRAPAWQPPPQKEDLFAHVAGHGAFRFRDEDAPKLERLRERLGPLGGARILEPGCGSGPLTTHLARWSSPGGLVEAFDPSETMLGHAQLNLRGVSGVRLTRGRCEDLEWPAGAFDRIVCFRVLPHFDDLDAVLRRFARWLCPGGRLVIAHWEGREALNAIHAAHGGVEQEVFPQRSYLEPALHRRGLAVRAWIDDPEEIHIEAELQAQTEADSAFGDRP